MSGEWTLYVCRACGWRMATKEGDLSCENCGEPRRMIETVEVVPLARLEEENRRLREALSFIAHSHDNSPSAWTPAHAHSCVEIARAALASPPEDRDG